MKTTMTYRTEAEAREMVSLVGRYLREGHTLSIVYPTLDGGWAFDVEGPEEPRRGEDPWWYTVHQAACARCGDVEAPTTATLLHMAAIADGDPREQHQAIRPLETMAEVDDALGWERASVRADCGCTLTRDVDHPLCSICGGCERHCECICERGHRYEARDDCLTCLGEETA